MDAAFIRETMERMKDLDKDLRWMGCHTLTLKLQSTSATSLPLTAEQENRFLEVVCKVVKDRSASVAQKAQNMLGPLVVRLRPSSVHMLLKVLVQLVIEEKEDEKREVGVLGLKAVLASLSKEQGTVVVDEVLSPIQAFLRTETTRQRQTDCLIVVSALLQRFGEGFTNSDLEELQVVILKLFDTLPSRYEERKPALICLSSLASCMGNEQFGVLLTTIISSLSSSSSSSQLYADVQTITTLSKAVGYRFVPHLPTLIPELLRIASDPNTLTNLDLFDSCFSSLQSIVGSCSKEMQGFMEPILSLSLRFLSYDPDYESGDGEIEMRETDVGGFSDDEEGFGFSSEEGFSSGGEGGVFGDDDDDAIEVEEIEDETWRVRKVCAKVLCALVRSNPDLLPIFLDQLPKPLLTRFCDRVETVQLEAMGVCDALASHAKDSLEISLSPASVGVFSKVHVLLQGIVQVANRILTRDHPNPVKSRSEGVVHKVFETLLRFVEVNGAYKGREKEGILSEQDLGVVLRHCLVIVTGKSEFSSVLIHSDGLALMCECLKWHSPGLYMGFVGELVEGLCQSANQKNKAIMVESLKGLRILFSHASPQKNNNTALAESFKREVEGKVEGVCSVAHHRLKSNDSDQEIKETSISLLGCLVAIFGESLKARLGSISRRVDNELTRLASLNALVEIAKSNHVAMLVPYVPSLVPKLIEFFRNRSRLLQVSSLSVLHTLCCPSPSSPPLSFEIPNMVDVVVALRGLISLSDLNLCTLSLSTLSGCLRTIPSSRATITENIYRFTLQLHSQPLLQGSALSALCDFYVELAKCGDEGGVKLNNILNDLYGLVAEGMKNKDFSIDSVANSVARLLVGCGALDLVGEFVGKIEKDKPSSIPYLAYIDQIGQLSDLSNDSELPQRLVSVLDGENQQVVQYGAKALGGVSVGCPKCFLPLIVREIENIHQNNVVSYLQALQMTLSSPSSFGCMGPFISDILSSLQSLSDRITKIPSSTVGTVLGVLAKHDPSVINWTVEQLKLQSMDQIALLTAPRYIIQEKPQPNIDTTLLPHIPLFFISPLSSPSNQIAKTALESLKVICHTNTSFLLPSLPSLVSSLYEATKRKNVKEYKFGASLHIEDDEESNRLLAFECLDGLLPVCSGRINMSDFVGRVSEGLQDMYHVKLKCHSLLCHLASTPYAVDAVVAHTDHIVDGLWLTISKELPKNESQREVDKQEEMVRGALRTVMVLETIPHAAHNPKMKKLLSDILASKFGSEFQALRVCDGREEGNGMSSS